MKLSISTGTLFTFPLEKVFTIAMETGFDGVELIINHEFQKVNSRRLIKDLSEILPVFSMHAPFMPLDGWGTPMDSLKRSVEIAADCGIKLVNFHPPHGWEANSASGAGCTGLWIFRKRWGGKG